MAALLVLFLASVFLPTGTAAADGEGMVLEGSGIRYPDGFDPNTVGEVRGTARGFMRPDRGPVRFFLDTERGSYTVLGAPAWYWGDIQATVPDGSEVRVRGSKTLGRDGSLYIIAQEVQVVGSGRSFVLRYENGSPLWTGPKTGPGGTRGGFGSPMRGGGMGGGFRGMGGGHR